MKKDASPQTGGIDRSLTMGEKFCGVNFNPSQNPMVAESKQRFAAEADRVFTWRDTLGRDLRTDERLIYEAALQHISIAQMEVTKLLTYAL